MREIKSTVYPRLNLLKIFLYPLRISQFISTKEEYFKMIEQSACATKVLELSVYVRENETFLYRKNSMRSLKNLYILYNTSTIKLAFEEYYVRRRELYQSLITGTFV